MELQEIILWHISSKRDKAITPVYGVKQGQKTPLVHIFTKVSTVIFTEISSNGKVGRVPILLDARSY